jgi:hypothetical protein
VDQDRFDTGAFGGRPPRGRGNGAMSARVLNFPGSAALEVTTKSEGLVRVGGRKLLVRRSGTGPPILLLTGMGMSLAAWTPFLRHLHGFECIEVAMPGSSAIVVRQPVLTMPKFAALARELLDRLDIARADVLGLSSVDWSPSNSPTTRPPESAGWSWSRRHAGWERCPVTRRVGGMRCCRAFGPPLAGRVRSGWRADGCKWSSVNSAPDGQPVRGRADWPSRSLPHHCGPVCSGCRG